MSIPAAWHPDPTGRHEYRYWDGEKWTDHVADAGQMSTDPLSPAPATAATADDTQSAPAYEATPHGDDDQPQEQATATSPTDEAVPDQQLAPTAATVADDASRDTTEVDASDDAGEADTPTTDLSQIRTASHDATTADAQAADQPAASDGPPAIPDAAAREAATSASVTGEQMFAPPTPTPTPAAASWEPTPQSRPTTSNGLAIAAMIIGIVSLLFAFIPVIGLIGVLGGLIGLLLGIVAHGRAKRGATGRGAAITGIVTGILAMIVGAVITVLVVVFFDGMGGEFTAYMQCVEQTGDEALCADQFEQSLFDRMMRN